MIESSNRQAPFAADDMQPLTQWEKHADNIA
jgi:hypothetical protein